MKIFDNFDVNSFSKKIPIGYILEADLEYPEKSCKLHNGYPLAPEKLAILMKCQIIGKKLQMNIE